MTDGGAGIVLVTDKCLREHPGARPTRGRSTAGVTALSVWVFSRSWTTMPMIRT